MSQLTDRYSSRISGRYENGEPRLYGDFLRTYKDTVVNLLEINDWGELLTAVMDDQGNYDSMSVAGYENYLVDFIRHWDDPDLFIGAYI